MSDEKQQINSRQSLYMAAIKCGHKIDEDTVTLYRDSNKDGNALSQLADRLAEASRRAPAQEQAKPSEIDIGHGAFLRFELKTTGAPGWLMYNEHGLVRALTECEILLVNSALAAHPPASPSAPKRSGKLEDDWPSLDDVAPLIKAQLGYVPGTPAPEADSSSAAPSDEAKCWQLAYAIRDWYRSQWPEHGGIQENDPPFSKFLAAPAPTVAAPSDDAAINRCNRCGYLATESGHGSCLTTTLTNTTLPTENPYAKALTQLLESQSVSRLEEEALEAWAFRALTAALSAPTGASQSAEQPIKSVALNLDAQLRSVIKERDGLRAALAQTQANSDDISAHLGAMTKTATTLRAAAMPAQAGVVPEFRIVNKGGIEAWLEFEGGSISLNNVANERGPIVRQNMGNAIIRFLAGVPAKPRTLADADSASSKLVTLNSAQITELLEAVSDDGDDADTEITLIEHAQPFKSTDGEDMAAGLYFYWDEYPEEGIVYLTAAPANKEVM